MMKLVNVSKYYYGKNSVALGLRKINLVFSKGEFVAITGESGSGKTTLLSIISGLLPYEEGEIYFQGNATSYFDETDWEQYRKDHIAFVFQNYNLIDQYTALENVMSSLLIQGEEHKKAKEKSLKLLERVGIAEYANHRATELSSGQKQRLSIARALAKDTEVIVADEPTGNLDAENGRQIMELFAELAKEKLVLVVTHNYEEAAPFVNRKIVIHDGEVEEDIPIGSVDRVEEIEDFCQFENENDSEVQKEVLATTDKKNSETRISWIFASMNMTSRLGKSVFLTMFLLVMSLAYFLFFGNFIANIDDTATKVYENSAFYNSDNTRIVVRHSDGSTMTDEDIAFLKGLKHVVYTDKYSLVNDLYYFSEKGVDYQVIYNNVQTEREGDPIYQENIYLDSFSKFMRSSSGLTEEDLAYGILPSTTNDVVIYTEDASLLGTTFSCFFCNKREWPINAYIRMEMTVCGILKEPTEQYYFSEKLCKVLGNDALGYQYSYAFMEDLRIHNVRLYLDDSYELSMDQIVTAGDIYESRKNSRYLFVGLLASDFGNWISRLTIDKTGTETPIVVEKHNSSEKFMIVSDQAYEELTQNMTLTQVAAYIEDYAYMDDVLSDIRKAGYEAVAPYRIGSVSYDDEKVLERLVTLCISMVALIVLFVLEIMIVKAFMKTDKNNALILKSIGMNQKTLSYMNGFTLLSYHTIAFGVMLMLVAFVGKKIPQFNRLLIYYRGCHIFILLVISMAAVFVTVMLYNRYLARLLKAGSEVRVS